MKQDKDKYCIVLLNGFITITPIETILPKRFNKKARFFEVNGDFTMADLNDWITRFYYCSDIKEITKEINK